jgi:hypothetical protein
MITGHETYPTESNNNVYSPLFSRSQDSVVGIATGYGLDDQGNGVRVPVGTRFFFPPAFKLVMGHTQPLIE